MLGCDDNQSVVQSQATANFHRQSDQEPQDASFALSLHPCLAFMSGCLGHGSLA
jgi:hypothetical protein